MAKITLRGLGNLHPKVVENWHQGVTVGVSQDLPEYKGIRITPEEWPTLRQAIDAVMAEHERKKPG